MNSCPKCEGNMEEGFIADRTGDLSLKTKPEWATDTQFGVGLKNAHKVVTYRCARCGYLESFAK